MKQIIYIIVILISFGFGLPSKIQKKIDKEITAVFEIENFSLEPKSFTKAITEKLPATFDDDHFFEIKVDDKLLGYAYTAKAPSKTAEFDYLVLFDADLIVKRSKVLIYREEYGGEIGSKRWLKQFIGKSKDDDLRYGDNIIAISGATISVRSMTNAMNNLFASLKILQNKHLL